MHTELSRACFDLLVKAAENNIDLSAESPALDELSDMGYVRDGKITKEGLDALEPYRVKRAIFLAAGFGSRMVPVTLKTPKPLITVNGGRLIDGLIDACLDAGVEEIYVVRGYLAREFDRLLDKYPMIKFIDNTMYTEANNISSALLAKDLLQNTYVLEADLLLSNPEIIAKYHYQSNFLAINTDETDDWCFEVENGIIVKEKVGGKNCWQMVGISYWNSEDGASLSNDLKLAFERDGGRDYYWEQVPLEYCKDNYRVAVRECVSEDIVEIDTFDELKQIDPSYNNFEER